MSLASVRAFFAAKNFPVELLETEQSTATVALAAQAHGVTPGEIAKTLAFRLADGRAILLVAAGDARVSNSKFKQALGKGKMLGGDEVVALTGHPVGGVCPFGLAQPLPIFLDRSLKAYREVLPAAGSINSAVRISVENLAWLTEGTWVEATE